MTREEIAALAKGVVPYVREVVDEAIAKAVAPKHNGNGGGAMDLQSAFDAGFEAVKKYIDAELAARDAKHDALVARFAELERDALTNGDVWREASLYRCNAVVTHDGTLHVAKEANSRARPGHSNAWRAMHKTLKNR